MRTIRQSVRKRTLFLWPTKVGRGFIAPSAVMHPLFGALKLRPTANRCASAPGSAEQDRDCDVAALGSQDVVGA
ncbi:MAG: hypothetical protein Q8O70_10745, partial [Burkholderiales bacterium]|nr:hypothetical protein [Burkholderiales bacterium]